MKLFSLWNTLKEKVETNQRPNFSERDIWMAFIGENVGFEQSGKGKLFLRPIIIFKKFSKDFFIAIPVSRVKKRGIFYFNFSFIKNTESVAVLSQIRPIDAKRLKYRMGYICTQDMQKLKTTLKNLLF